MSPPIAIVFRDPPPDQPQRGWPRFAAIAEALRAAGLAPQPCAYDESRGGAVLAQLRASAAALVWVNPVQDGRGRDGLNDLLRAAADDGVLVSAHPDVIARLGSKSVLWETRALGWSGHAQFYGSERALRIGLPQTASVGPRVLKPNRGNDGRGVWKVSPVGAAEVEVQEAAGGPPQKTSLAAFLDARAAELAAAGGFIDQAYEPRVREGMIRCYLAGATVAGFGAQAGVALGGGPLTPRLYSGPDDPRFQTLRRRLEDEWLQGLVRTLGLAAHELPLIWDADFLLGVRDATGADTYVLCEVNVSSVFPIPDTAPPMIAAALRARLGL